MAVTVRLLTTVKGDVNPPSATPKTTHIGGVKFYRTRNGNLVRHGIIKAKQCVLLSCAKHTLTWIRMAGGFKKVNEQCKTFSWNGIVSHFTTSQHHFANRTSFAAIW